MKILYEFQLFKKLPNYTGSSNVECNSIAFLVQEICKNFEVSKHAAIKAQVAKLEIKNTKLLKHFSTSDLMANGLDIFVATAIVEFFNEKK